jgi:hypothetical protein
LVILKRSQKYLLSFQVFMQTLVSLVVLYVQFIIVHQEPHLVVKSLASGGGDLGSRPHSDSR